MAYSVDPQNGDLVINGFQNGIGDSPYLGLTDVRNVNTVSIPGEAPINFKTTAISSTAITGTISTASGSVATFTGVSGTLENYVAIYFTSVGSFAGASTATPYWLGNQSGSTYILYSDYNQTTSIALGNAGANATFVAYQVGAKPSYVTAGSSGGATGVIGIQHFAQPINIQDSFLASYFTFGVDGFGLVWSNFYTTGTNHYWTYTGNLITNGASNAGGQVDNGVSNASGNGLVYWRVSDNAGGSSTTEADYLFVFRNSQIDFFVVQQHGAGLTTGTWTNGWNPSTGATGQVNYLTMPPGTAGSHQSIVAPDGRVYYCDVNNINKWFQTAQNTRFVPTNTTTYTFLTFNLLPVSDLAQCLAPLGVNILIGGQTNQVYVWDTTSNLIGYYIPIAEPFVAKMVTVNTNTYIFAGNRGRIYYTNGSQAQLWKKIPDHLSGTIEPKYVWAGATSVKNQLYFSFYLLSNAGTPIATEGAVWGADLDTKSIRINNKLSYNTYAGYASAMIPQIYNPIANSSPTGSSLFIGWFDGANLSTPNCGIDQSATNAEIYTGGESYVISDMIPIGTAIQPVTPAQFEFKLSTPLLTGESVQLLVASSVNGSYTSLGTTNGDGSLLSGIFPNQIQNQQWVLLKAVLTGKTIASSPSFNRLTELRIKGATLSRSSMTGFNTE